MLKWMLAKLGYVKLNTMNHFVYKKASIFLDIDLTYLVNDMLHTTIYTDETMKEVAQNLI